MIGYGSTTRTDLGKQKTVGKNGLSQTLARTRAEHDVLDPQTAMILAGYGHSVSQTKLAGAAKGFYINMIGRTVVQEQAAGNRILKTRATVSEKEQQHEKKNHY